MRVHRALAQQAHLLVHTQITARLGKQLGYPSNFIGVFRHMGLHPDAGVLRGQLSRAAQLRFAGGGGKPWRDGVAQAVHAMPTPNQRFGFIQALLGAAVTQTIRAVAVLQHPSAQHAQLAFLRFLKERIH